MTQPAETYTPLAWQGHFRSQAIRVWAVTLALVLLWTGLIVAAPIFDVSTIYTFFSYLCHQIPERSLHVTAKQMAVCSRCFGVYSGLLVGTALYPVWRSIDETEPVSRFWLVLSLIPITVDWSLTVFGLWENTHLSRFVTGLILGAACATFIIPALIDITWNLAVRRFQTK